MSQEQHRYTTEEEETITLFLMIEEEEIKRFFKATEPHQEVSKKKRTGTEAPSGQNDYFLFVH